MSFARFFNRNSLPDGCVEMFFVPQPDITAFELAEIFARVSTSTAPRYGVLMPIDVLNAMPPTLRRHWSTSEPQD